METVTAIGVFVIVVTTVGNLYLVYSRAHRISGQRQKIITVANALLDQIAREVRTYELAYWGALDYNRAAPAETIYRVDYNGAEAGNPYTNTNIYQFERELVLYDNFDWDNNTASTIIAYLFGDRSWCPDDTRTELATGFFRFYRDANDTTLRCQRLFDIPGLTVTDAVFFFTQPLNPYPDAFDPATDLDPNRDADCAPTTSSASKFNGSFCTCNVIADCFWSCYTTGKRCLYPSANYQPAVTFSFTVQDDNHPATTLTFQTTAVQRLYKR